MTTRHMSKQECLKMLVGPRLARLACAHENQPYIVPVYIAYSDTAEDEPCLYGFTIPGQKLDWMRANPHVCVEVDEIEACDRWRSVIAVGRFEELPEIPGSDHVRPRTLLYPPREANSPDERMHAYQLLQTRTSWWQPGWAAWEGRPQAVRAKPYEPIYYKIRIDQISGHEAVRDICETNSCPVPTASTRPWGWLVRTLKNMFGGNPKVPGSAS